MSATKYQVWFTLLDKVALAEEKANLARGVLDGATRDLGEKEARAQVEAFKAERVELCAKHDLSVRLCAQMALADLPDEIRVVRRRYDAARRSVQRVFGTSNPPSNTVDIDTWVKNIIAGYTSEAIIEMLTACADDLGYDLVKRA